MNIVINDKIARIAAIMGLKAVVLGAFGAHYLKTILGEQQLQWWEKAVQYQFYHIAPIFFLAILPYPKARLNTLIFILGCTFFCGSLYIMALTNMRWLGAITPIGGVLMIFGWGMLTLNLYKKN